MKQWTPSKKTAQALIFHARTGGANTSAKRQTLPSGTLARTRARSNSGAACVKRILLQTKCIECTAFDCTKAHRRARACGARTQPLIAPTR